MVSQEGKIVHMLRWLLKEGKLPNTFWGEAITTSNYIETRLYSRATANQKYGTGYDKIIASPTLRVLLSVAGKYESYSCF